MDQALITSSVTMGQIQQQLDTISNNLSNAETTGYKSRSSEFMDLLAQQIQNLPEKGDPGTRLTQTGVRMGVGAKLGDTGLSMIQGEIKVTDRPLDLALTKPDQFFKIGVTDKNGQTAVQYTRNGAFYLQPIPGNPNQVNLVTSDGNAVLGANDQRLQIPASAKDIRINESGAVEAVMQDDSRIPSGGLGIVTINRPQLLESKGGGLFAFPNLQTLGLGMNDVLQQTAGQDGAVQQGALEASNVNMSKELTDLMTVQRSYQFNARAITMSDQMMGLVNTLR